WRIRRRQSLHWARLGGKNLNKTMPANFNRQILKIDRAAEADRIVTALRHQVRKVMRRAGAVVGISGGVDSSVVLALAVRAFAPERVVAVMLPEKDSDP